THFFFQSYSFPAPFIHVFWTSNRVWSIRARSMARRKFLSPPFWVQIMGSSVFHSSLSLLRTNGRHTPPSFSPLAPPAPLSSVNYRF
ncbi:hypothetical protein VIGAN_11113200, partial [Vigna angularis var. angularis]